MRQIETRHSRSHVPGHDHSFDYNVHGFPYPSLVALVPIFPRKTYTFRSCIQFCWSQSSALLDSAYLRGIKAVFALPAFTQTVCIVWDLPRVFFLGLLADIIFRLRYHRNRISAWPLCWFQFACIGSDLCHEQALVNCYPARWHEAEDEADFFMYSYRH